MAGIDDYDIEAVSDNPTFHPGRTAVIRINDEQIAILGEIHPLVSKNYEAAERNYVAYVSMASLLKFGDTKRVYKHLPRFPAVSRDLAFVCEAELPVLRIERIIKSAVGAILEDISLFDVYIGSQIPDGMKSVAFSLRLRAADRTLTDEEADNATNKAIKALKLIGVQLRS